MRALLAQQQMQQQQMAARLTPTPPSSTPSMGSDYATVGAHPCMSCESGALSQHLQQLQLQQHQQQPHLQQFSPSPPLSSASCGGSSSCSSSIVQENVRPMGSIVNGTPIVSQGATMVASTQPTLLGFFNMDNSQASGMILPVRPQGGGSIMHGTPFNLPAVPNNHDIYPTQTPTCMPIASFGGGSITQGTPVNRVDVSSVEDMEADGVSDDDEENEASRPAEEALDLSIRTSMNRSDRDLSCHAAMQRVSRSLAAQAHPQISITDEQGEVTDMSWNAYAQLNGNNGIIRLNGLENFQNDMLSSAPSSSNDFSQSELHKSSSGSIKLQLSSNYSRMTVDEIFAWIEHSMITKGLVSFQEKEQDTAIAALTLQQPGEDVRVKVEVSQPVGLEGLKGLKIRRISGDHLRYDRICNELIACVTMS